MNERDIFIAALHQRDPAARADLLDRDCAGDQPLRIRVEELLREQEQLGSFLERPAAGLGETGAFTPPEGGETVVALFEGPGTMIGPYKLLEPIGEGGMGTVFLAQQSEPVKRLVALKVIKAGMDSRQVVARFEAERQALALMDHPHIAKVLDGGTTTGGRPYFVMELVKGVPLTRYCDEQRLTPRQRLELFVPVCQAIQHAHQKGIIHRDVKPSNVLVALYDGQAVPKVIDFGIAKATSQPLTEKTLVTGLGSVVGTLEYMSPEQAELNQMDVDTRSDVYSLGVLLYELLTGTTPLERKRLKDTGLLEVLRLIREEEPPRPSTRLSSTDERPSVAANRGLEPKKLSGLVRGELDWIVMKSLEKDRNRRYETANGFAADVQRYLHDEPVLACPPSAVYRLRKFARRNQGSLAVAALVLFSLASLGGVAGWAAWDRTTRRAALEADVGRNLDAARAFCRADQLREASAVLDHAQALVSRGEVGGELARRVALVRTDVDMAARLEAIRLEKAAVKDEHFDWAGADVQYGEAFRDYGLDVGQLGPGEAAARLEVSAIREQLVTALDDWSLSTSGGNRQQLLAVLTRADADPWRTQLRTAFVDGNAEALRELAGEPNVSVQSAGAAVLMGNALCQLGDIGLAVEYLRGAQQEYPSDFWLNQNLGSLLMHLKSARMCEAVGYLRAALALRPDSPGVLVNLGLALRDQGNIAGALAAFQKAIARKPDYAMAHCNLGDTLGQQGDLAGALAAYQKAVALKPNYAYAHYLLGNALRDQGNLSGALAAFQKAIALKPNYAEAHCNLGHVLRRQGEFAKALEELRLGHELGSKNPRWSYPSAQWVRYCEHLLELDGRLHDFLAGKAKPANVGERIKLARICAFKQWNRAALRFYEEAFAARPTLRVAHRYDSACAAALAGCGQGKDADKLDDKERVRLRRQALDWLYADLEAWDRLLDKQPGRSAANVATGLQHWLVDPALRGVRGPEALAKLSAEEQEEWDCLWTEVAEQAARPVQAARDAAWRNPPAADPPTTPAALAVRIEAQLDLAGPTVAGGNFDLKQLRGKVVLIDFWASWCGPCVAEMPNVKRVYDRYHKYGFEVVGVSLDNKKETLLQFLKAKQVPWPQLFFADKDAQGWNNPLARKCGIHGIPYTILVDPAGKVFRLGLRGATLEPAVAKLLGKGPDSLADMPRLAQGRYYVRLGLGAKASGSYAKIFAAEPKDAAGWRTRSEHFLRLGLWDLAARDLAAAFKLEAPTTYRQCLSHALTNVYTDDTASYRQLCSLIPKRFQQDAGDAYGASEMVRACIVAGSPVADLGWAVRMGEKCVAKGSARWWCHADLGLAYYRAGAYERAVEQLERARQIDPIAEISTDPVLAMAYYRLGRTKEAHEALSRATRLADQVSESIAFSTLGSMPLGWWAWLCHVLLYREARTLIDGSPPPDNPLWETARARAFAALGEQKKAETACAKALSQAPKSLAVRLACARLHAELAQWDKAGADLAGDIEADPDKKRLTQFYFLRAMVNGRLDRFAEAVADFTQTRKPAADSPLVPNNLAWLLATCPQPKFRDPRRAVELAKKAVELAPREGGYWNTLGVAHYRAGDWKSAIDALNKSMERNRGGNAFDWLFLAMAQQKLGKAPEARQWYDKATAWVEKSRASALDPVQSEELRRFQREAQEVLEQKSKQ